MLQYLAAVVSNSIQLILYYILHHIRHLHKLYVSRREKKDKNNYARQKSFTYLCSVQRSKSFLAGHSVKWQQKRRGKEKKSNYISDGN